MPSSSHFMNFFLCVGVFYRQGKLIRKEHICCSPEISLFLLMLVFIKAKLLFMLNNLLFITMWTEEFLLKYELRQKERGKRK